MVNQALPATDFPKEHIVPSELLVVIKRINAVRGFKVTWLDSPLSSEAAAMGHSAGFYRRQLLYPEGMEAAFSR